jgi:hypothetical protein
MEATRHDLPANEPPAEEALDRDRAAAVASRDGDLVACDTGEVFEHAGRVPTSRLFDDDLTGRSPKTLVDALADRNQAFSAHEVASWTRGRRSINEIGIELLHHWFLPQRSAPPAITHWRAQPRRAVNLAAALRHHARDPPDPSPPSGSPSMKSDITTERRSPELE